MRTVFTNGCFDLFHIGHLYLLQEARKLGDLLIVAVNCDESVRRLKGPGRPIIPLEQRRALLRSLPFVDLVITQVQDDPIEILKIIRPNILVKGSGWGRDTVIGAEYAAHVHIVKNPYTITTTQIIERIKCASSSSATSSSTDTESAG